MSSSSSELLKSEIVRAGAGAGKTHGLTEHVLNNADLFYKAHDRMPRMLVTTFTIKATQELKERLMLKASERESSRLTKFVGSSSHLFISTIHGVFSQLLRKYGHAIGLESGFEVLSQSDERKIFYSALREILFAGKESQSLLESYSLQDLYSYCYFYYAKRLELGELRPMTYEDLEAELEQVQNQITKQAEQIASELKYAIENGDTKSKRLEKWAQVLSVFLSWSSLSNISYSEFISCIDTDISSFGNFPSNPENKPVLDFSISSKAKEFWNEVKSSLSKDNRSADSLQIFAENNQAFFELAESVYAWVFRYKISNAKISMWDIELLSKYLIDRHPELAQSFSMEWDYWLIDEFQDTSPFQLKLLRSLIGDSPYFVVGDPQQSIYYFRGAEHRLFEQEEKLFEEKKLLKRSLMKNYRSQPECMAFINDAMAEYGFDRMQEREDTFDANYLAAKFLSAPTRKEEKQMIVSEIKKLLMEGIPAGEICVLSRTNRDLMEISQLLNGSKISNYVHSSGSFFEKREVLDLISILNFLVNPEDDKNLIQLLRSPWFYVADDILFQQESRKQNLWLCLQEMNLENIRYLSGLLEFMQEYGILCALEKAVEERGILEFSRQYDPSGKREANIWKFLLDLREKEHKSFFNPLDYVHLAKAISASKGEGESEAAAALEPNRVQLMTIHASKGLEFPYVFVCSMSKSPQTSKTLSFYCSEEGSFSIPSPLGEESKKAFPLGAEAEIAEIRTKELEESYRLLYVAMTRAEKRLYCSFSEKIDKNSWMEAFSWKLDEGLVKKEKYSYQVCLWSEEEINLSDSSTVKSPRKQKVPEKISSLESIHKPLETESVSRILEQRTEFGKQQRKTEDADFSGADIYVEKLQKAVWGTRLHLLLEAMVRTRNTDFESFLEEVLEEDEYQDFLPSAQYLSQLVEPPFLDLIPNAKVEWGFILKEKDLLIEGQVDFWGRDTKGNIWILDYKTGSSRYSDKAKEQLQMYALAVSKMCPGEPIFCSAIYISEQKVFVWPYSREQHLESLQL